MINLIYQIDKFVKSEHQFVIDIMKRILEHIKFVIKNILKNLMNLINQLIINM